MNTKFSKPVVVFGAVLALGVLTQGCATKKYVNQTVSPVDQRVTEVARQTDAHGKAIEDLDSKTEASVSRLDENIRTAQRIAEDATRMAQGAGDTANTAWGATQENQKTIAVLENRLGNVHQFQLHATESVRFAVNRHELDDEAKATLSELMGKTKPMPVFVVEVQGYTDPTGPRAYNLSLSEKRAEAVVRHLTTTYNVPLRNIHKLGVGSEDPVADNSTREGRQQNRRVEIRVYIPEVNPAPAVSDRRENANTVKTSAANY